LAEVVAGIFAGRLRNGIMTVGVLAAAERLRGAAGAPRP
jgi:ADP-ribose pyrophosphatase